MGEWREEFEVGELRRLGAALSGIGMPWILTIFGGSGLSLDGHWIVPLLWFAPQFLFTRLYRAARCSLASAGPAWWVTLVVGVCCWATAVPASVLGAEQVMAAAHGIGLVAGTILFCGAMLSLTRSIRWLQHVRYWRTARRTMLASVGLAVVGGALGWTGERWAETGVALRGWAVVLILCAMVLCVLAWARMARILRATRAGLLEIPDPPDPARLGAMFSTAPTKG